MIRPLMSRPAKVLLMIVAAIAVTGLTTACGTEKIALAPENPDYNGAVLFNQRCSGCHTLSYAATHGSAANVRTREITNGPNFDQRCERPVTRVLYAIQNGGFSGAIMPQNVVVGQQAIEVAKFVATYAGRQAMTSPGVLSCQQQPIGTIPNFSAATATSSTNTTPASTTRTARTPAPLTKKQQRQKRRNKNTAKNAAQG